MDQFIFWDNNFCIVAHLSNNQIHIFFNKNFHLVPELLHHSLFTSSTWIQWRSLTDWASKKCPSLLGHALGQVTCCLVYFGGLKQNFKTILLKAVFLREGQRQILILQLRFIEKIQKQSIELRPSNGSDQNWCFGLVPLLGSPSKTVAPKKN